MCQAQNALIPHTEAVTSQTLTYCFPSIVYLKPKGERVAPSRKRFLTLKSISKVLCQLGVIGNFLTVPTLCQLQPLPNRVYLVQTVHQPRHQLHVLPREHREGFVWRQHVVSIYLSQQLTTRNPLTLKIKRELCNLTLKGLCLFNFFKTASSSSALHPQKQPSESYSCPLPTQTHCFPPGRLQASPWSAPGSSVGTTGTGLPLHAVLPNLEHRTLVSSRSPCFDFGH